MTNTTLTKVSSCRWEDKNGNYIWKDDFGTYIISVNGNHECANTLDKALAIMDLDKFWK